MCRVSQTLVGISQDLHDGIQPPGNVVIFVLWTSEQKLERMDQPLNRVVWWNGSRGKLIQYSPKDNRQSAAVRSTGLITITKAGESNQTKQWHFSVSHTTGDQCTDQGGWCFGLTALRHIAKVGTSSGITSAGFRTTGAWRDPLGEAETPERPHRSSTAEQSKSLKSAGPQRVTAASDVLVRSVTCFSAKSLVMDIAECR